MGPDSPGKSRFQVQGVWPAIKGDQQPRFKRYCAAYPDGRHDATYLKLRNLENL